MEGSEIYGVLRQFENENDQVFGHNLKKIISGPVIPDENETKTQSRDIMFELNMAAHFKKTNINCFLAEPDLKIKYKDYELFVKDYEEKKNESKNEIWGNW